MSAKFVKTDLQRHLYYMHYMLYIYVFYVYIYIYIHMYKPLYNPEHVSRKIRPNHCTFRGEIIQFDFLAYPEKIMFIRVKLFSLFTTNYPKRPLHLDKFAS